jgi:hypothetical protein
VGLPPQLLPVRWADQVSTSLLLLLPAIPIHAVYFVRFSRLIAGLDGDQRSRFTKSGTPVWNLLAIGGTVLLLLSHRAELRAAAVLWLAVFLVVATRYHHKRLAEAGFGADFLTRLRRLTSLSGVGIALVVVALALR